MDLSKFSSNEKLMLYGAVAAAIGGIIGGISSIIWIVVLAGIAMLVVLFLPQLSPQTSLPGSRGSVLVLVGGIGAVAAALAFLAILVDIGFWLEFSAVRTIFFLIGVAGALLVGWIAWQEFQAEGGKFQLGASSSATVPPAAPSETPPASAPSAAAEPPAQPPASEPPPTYTEPAPSADAPADTDDEGRPPA
jgi:hypothetical protein